MANIYKTLGQSNPTATTLTDLYIVPANTSAVASTLTICNQGTSTTFRVAVRPLGEALSAKNYIVYDSSVNQNDSIFLTIGLSLEATDVITVYAGNSSLSFTLSGTEIT